MDIPSDIYDGGLSVRFEENENDEKKEIEELGEEESEQERRKEEGLC